MAFSTFSSVGSSGIGAMSKKKVTPILSALRTWTSKSIIGSWVYSYMTPDSTKIVAVLYSNSKPYISTNSGNTFTTITNAPAQTYRSICISPNGSNIIAAVYNGYLYVSIDSGNTWSQKESIRKWLFLKMSYDGTKIIASTEGGNLYISSNSGNSWSPLNNMGSRSWWDVAISNDGQKIYACHNSGIRYSFNGGTSSSDIVSGGFTTISLSGNENTLLAAIEGSKIYFWPDISDTSIYLVYDTSPLPTTGSWRGSACSYDGTILIMGDFNTSSGGVYISNNAGASWTKQNTVNNKSIVSVSCSMNADIIIACDFQSTLYLGI